GRHGRHLPRIGRGPQRADRRDRARGAARQPPLRGAAEGPAGLVHPPPRPRGEPRQHPARGGHPARDPAARAALRHHGRPAPEGPARPPRMSAVLPISLDEAADLADEFESRPAEDLVRWTAERFGDRAVLTCSWQKQSSVLVHMLSEVAPTLRVVEFDTGLLFPETYDTRKRLIERYPIKFERIEPELTVEQQAEAHGDRLWERDPDACCG